MLYTLRYWFLRLRVEHARASVGAQVHYLEQSIVDLAQSKRELVDLQNQLAAAETAFLMRRYS